MASGGAALASCHVPVRRTSTPHRDANGVTASRGQPGAPPCGPPTRDPPSAARHIGEFTMRCQRPIGGREAAGSFVGARADGRSAER